ncbi:hypothetical protein L1787_13645 [Acuticoccus sp. M5D2P5]|uniref:hypothetical protein n=1 Tax=Acuticoccus kalidii TaxID=2910977 RepID=UPI001F1C31B1|nr:hypothetical protein [Acuticoccus kalidii]MCF3934448.1 hypothetical protein [Acuticoccus kalidii]
MLALLGWRGLAGAGLGAVLVTVPAYQAGKWTEGAKTEAEIGRVLAERHVERMEAENARIATALAARRRAAGSVGVGDGMPDDGFRRD